MHMVGFLQFHARRAVQELAGHAQVNANGPMVGEQRELLAVS
jgi:hypothetical protein